MLIDLAIIALCIIAVRRGYRVGFLHQVFGIGGFFVGLFIGAFIAKIVVPSIDGQANRSLATVVLTLGLAMAFVLAGEELGVRTKRRMQRLSINKFDSFSGGALNFCTILIGIWFVANLIGSVNWWTAQIALQDSKLVSTLNRNLPWAPKIVNDIGRVINPNGTPRVFVDKSSEPAPSKMSMPSTSSLTSATTRTKPSVYKVMGQGCGGIIDGTGFVVRAETIATNAHVVAGIKQPYIQNDAGIYKASVIGFDPDRDIAILHVDGLQSAAIPFIATVAEQGTPAVVLGYPGGGNFTVEPAVIARGFQATGRDIYDKKRTVRNIYDVRAKIIAGNSGGPVINSDGAAIGMVFAESTTYQNTGYALKATTVDRAVEKAVTENKIRSTGSCVQ